jgi:dihydroorotase/N-acyl-D-amino-acid deacylase
VQGRDLLTVVILAAVSIAGSLVALGAQAPGYDLLLKNARVVDGTGSPWFRADIGVRGDAIATIARQIDAPSVRTIDAANLVVAPGFVDIHVHAFGGAGQPPSVFPIVEVPTADNYVRQGVTTLITGPDGSSPVPLRPALDAVARTGVIPNLGTFIGHGAIRSAVFGSVNRPPTLDELERMRALVREGMRDGAFGLSTGLFYVPATFSKTDEVVELAKVAGAMGGIHISHLRNEELGVEASVRETIAVGELGGLPTQVTHHKIIGKASWGKTVETLQLIDQARQRGVDVTLDCTPTASHQHFGGADAHLGARGQSRRGRWPVARPIDAASDSDRDDPDHPRRPRWRRCRQHHGVAVRLEPVVGGPAPRRCCSRPWQVPIGRRCRGYGALAGRKR